MLAYTALFGSAFLAATLVPFYSEVAAAGMVVVGHEPLAVLGVATLGNTLGAAVNWGLGRYLLRFRDRRWFPIRGRQLEIAQNWFRRWGAWSLLLAWLPVGGDALTFVAGVMRVRFALFLVLVGAGKGARYAVLIWAVEAAR